MKELWVPLSGALSQAKNVDVIANNLANVNSIGFKRDQLSFREHLADMNNATGEENRNGNIPPEHFYKTYGFEHGYVAADVVKTIQEQGNLTPTHNPLDLGISGDAFFEVMTSHGPRYTRNGSFTIGNDRSLMTSQGFLVLSKSGGEADRKISIPASAKGISISRKGEVFVDGSKIAELSLISFQDRNELLKEGSNLFINREGKNIKPSNSSEVLQGFLEESNVNAIAEMTELIKAHHNFENLQRVIKTYDAMAGKAVNEINKW